MQADKYTVAVAGAGPAGLYAARHLANAGVRIVIFNRDLKPGGLAEYGIYPDKHKLKEGLRNQFRQILASPGIDYYGNIVVSRAGSITLEELREQGFQAILATVGAQGTKWLGLPGERLNRVYHAKDVVYHYNRLPPFSSRKMEIGERVAIVGAGNVMMDVGHWLIRELKVQEVIAVVRRGPADVKFDKREFELIAANLDISAFDAEVARVTPLMESAGQKPTEAVATILSALPRALSRSSDTRFRFEFLVSPLRMLDDGYDSVGGLVVEDNRLIQANGDTKARGQGTRRVLDVDTVIFAIGDRVDEAFGLPLENNEFAKNPSPRFPVEGVSYEAYDPQINAAIPDVFLAGWARLASTGLVGVARKDGERGARAVLAYLETLEGAHANCLERLRLHFRNLGVPVIDKGDVKHLEEIERGEAENLGLEEFKFDSNETMLIALNKVPVRLSP